MSDRTGTARAVYDVDALAPRVAKVEARATAVQQADPDGAAAIRAKGLATVMRCADDVIAEAAKAGSAAPTLQHAMKTSFRVEMAGTPPGSHAPPALVVRFDANSPLQRLVRAGRASGAPVLEPMHLDAARELARLHELALKPPKLTASYEPRGGGGGQASWSEIRCDAWDKMRDGLHALLPAEGRVVLAVVVHDTPIAVLAKSGLLPMVKLTRAEGAIVQTLRLGLERLSVVWATWAPKPDPT